MDLQDKCKDVRNFSSFEAVGYFGKTFTLRNLFRETYSQILRGCQTAKCLFIHVSLKKCSSLLYTTPDIYGTENPRRINFANIFTPEGQWLSRNLLTIA